MDANYETNREVPQDCCYCKKPILKKKDFSEDDGYEIECDFFTQQYILNRRPVHKKCYLKNCQATISSYRSEYNTVIQELNLLSSLKKNNVSKKVSEEIFMEKVVCCECQQFISNAEDKSPVDGYIFDMDESSSEKGIKFIRLPVHKRCFAASSERALNLLYFLTDEIFLRLKVLDAKIKNHETQDPDVGEKM